MTLVSAEPVRKHVLKLRAAGGTYASIGQAATTGAMTVHCIANARRPKVQAEVASRLLTVSEADIRSMHRPPGGIMWRLRALIAMGHTCSRMAHPIPGSHGALTLRPSTLAILALYRGFTWFKWQTDPPWPKSFICSCSW
jgi:hypothetical protein